MGEIVDPEVAAASAIIAPPSLATPLATDRTKMPPDIAVAIVKVMAAITPLSKDTRNKFQNYDYVSVDQFYDLVGRLMSEAGIFTVLYEKSMDVGERKTTDDRGNVKTSLWLQAVYDVWLYHKSGSSFGPVERSIIVPAAGAQSYASAISFTEKYYLRSLFKIPTGDQDVDGDEKRNLPQSRDTRRERHDTRGEPARTEQDEVAQSKDYYIKTAEREWSALETQSQMKGWWDAHKEAMGDIFDGANDPLYAELKAKYQARGKELTAERSVAA